MKGSYILLIHLYEDKNIQVGRLGKLFFKKGYYAYVGSAMNGIEQRVQRHLRHNKKTHWHIDYLLRHAEIKNVFYKENQHREECKIAEKLNKKLKNIQRFGCTDCKCNSHLFYGSLESIVDLIMKLGYVEYF